jgi:quinoprotein glucose dehydrogenase
MNRRLTITIVGVVLLAATAQGQKNWVYYGQDQGGTRYSSLDQISTSNVTSLTRAWTFHTGDKSGFFESTPLVIDSVVYFAAGNGFYALDAVTGQQIWKVDATRTTRRGVSYWPGDAQTAPRIIASAGTKLMALDAKTGKPVEAFGGTGSIEIADSMNSPAAIFRDLAIVQGNKPWIRAFDIRTGKLVWTFDLIPQPGQPGHDTWTDDGWKTAGGTNVWGLLSVDVVRGLVFLPVSMPGENDYYGGDHHGDNLFGTSVVALDAATGSLKWYRQLVHHDIWDYDLGAAPTLVDVVKDGRTIPAIAQITKMGLLFVLDRTTGEPVWGIEERAVPQTTAPGEQTSPTQPFPLKPPPLARNSMRRDELAKINTAHEAYCAGLWDKYKLSDSVPYTPWNDKQDIVLFPGAVGGGNWNGVTYHKDLGLMITNVMNAGQWGHLEPFTGAAGPAGRRASRGGGAGAAALAQSDTRGPALLGSGDDVLVSGAAMGRAGSGQHEDRRHRVARAARRLRRAGGARPQDGHAEPRRGDHHGWKSRLHRRDGRREVPRVRREGRQGAVERQARCSRPFNSVDISRQRRQTIRGRGRGRRRLPPEPDVRHRRRVQVEVTRRS